MKLDALTAPIDKTRSDILSQSSNPLRMLLSVNARTDDIGNQRVPLSIVILVFVGLPTIIFMLASNIAVLQIISIIIFVGAMVAGVVFAVSSTRKMLSDEVLSALRLEKFALDNGWTYNSASQTLKQPGILFTTGHDYKLTNVITSPTFEVGECQSKYGSGRNERSYSFAYMSVSLKHDIPNVVLDSKSNNMKLFGVEISNLPVFFDKSQVISLEGDFDKYFTLYAPNGYDADVRYIFTPDLMQILIAESDSTDIEIVDKVLYVYFGRYDIASPDFWQRVEQLNEKLQAKLVERAGERYEDDRTSTGTVAPKGRRLKSGVPIVAIIFVIIYGLSMIIRLVNDLNH